MSLPDVFACTGVCPGYENNGVCDTQNGICRKGTDCFDCTSPFPVWPVAGIIISLGFIGMSIYTIVLQCRRRASPEDAEARVPMT